MDKSPDAFRTISEVAEVLETPAHVLRFWESRFPQIKPVKRAGGRRYYRPSDVALLAGIKRLLHDEGLTIRGVQKILRDQGARHVAGLSDDSVELDDLIGDVEGLDDAALIAALDFEEDEPGITAAPQVPLTLSEAAFGAFDDPEDDGMENPPNPDRPGLPLFPAEIPWEDAPATAMTARPAVRSATPSGANIASVVRALPSGSLIMAQPELGLLAQRLTRHRAVVGDRAEGGQD